MAIGVWGQRWVRSNPSLRNLDPGLLMWDIRRNLDPSPMPTRRCVIEFTYPELPPAKRHWWLIVEPGKEIDLCGVDPGLDVDLYVATDLRTMTAIWMGLDDVRTAKANGRLELAGDGAFAVSIDNWLRLSPFAQEKKRVA